jgi:hypothetical protein
MVASENMLSVDGQHALQDMITLQMYLVYQSERTPWSMLPRSTKKREAREPYSDLVQSSVVRELLDRGFIEGTSNHTLVVSKSGHHYYERQMNGFQLNRSRPGIDATPSK